MATLVARPGGGGEAPETAGGRLLQWLPDGSLLTVIVPSDRGPEPQEPVVPVSPIIRKQPRQGNADDDAAVPAAHRHRRAPVQVLHDGAARRCSPPGRAPRLVGKPAMYLDYWVSPDGKSILRESIDEPLSYLVAFSSFGRRLEVIDLDGKVLSEIRRRPLQEAQSRGPDPAADNAPRDVAWRPDGKGLSMLWREPGGGNGDAAGPGAAPRKDRLMLLAPPFALASAQTIMSTGASHQQRPLFEGRPLCRDDAGQARSERQRRQRQRRQPRRPHRLRPDRVTAGAVRPQGEHRHRRSAEAARRSDDDGHGQRRRLAHRLR